VEQYVALNLEDINSNLASRWVGQTIHFYMRLGSTNLTAMDLAEKGAPEGTVVIAEQQLQGRGRADRSWHSPSGVGIYCSILLRPKLFPGAAQILTLMTAVAATKAITLKTNLQPRIKWPNDILINNKKVAGILLEGKTSATVMECAIVGIGINVNHAASDLPAEIRPIATSLRIELGRPVERSALICQLLVEFENLYEKLHQGDSGTVLEQWRSLSATLDRRVKVLQKDKVTQGIAIGVATDGSLVLRTEDGSLRLFHAGEVEHLNMTGSE